MKKWIFAALVIEIIEIGAIVRLSGRPHKVYYTIPRRD